MACRTVYIDLDHAGIERTIEGIEIGTTDDVVVLNGTRRALRDLGVTLAAAYAADRDIVVQPGAAQAQRRGDA